MGGRQRHHGRLGPAEGATLERLDVGADAGLAAVGQERADEGALVTVVAEVEGEGERADFHGHATAPPWGGWSSIPSTGGRSSSSRASLRSRNPAAMPVACASYRSFRVTLTMASGLNLAVWLRGSSREMARSSLTSHGRTAYTSRLVDCISGEE